jgi:hypothetical protein
VLKAEKRALKIKLRRFEDEFIRQHGQKPQSYQEVRARPPTNQPGRARAGADGLCP